jgi:hypothetical protein
MDERRYSDEEVEEIFRRAAAPAEERRGLPARSGLTLAELQSIGGEVGVSPERIAEAAARLDHGAAALRSRTVLGRPVAVGRTVDLPRAPTDREWAILVSELREIFQAHGRESTSLATRSWNNGNLRVVVEPTEAGYRLRMGTRKGDAALSLVLALGLLLMGVLSILSADGASDELVSGLVLMLLAAGTFSYDAIRLPLWASRRNEQMDQVATRALELLSRPGPPSSPGES